MLTGIDNVDQFRAAKAEAIGRLQARGVDLCRVSQWGYWGTPNQTGYDNQDNLALPITCVPRAVAGDADAAPFLPAVQAAIAEAVRDNAADFGWRPDASITSVVVTNVDSAAEIYVRYRQTFDDPAQVENIARQGRSNAYWSFGPSSAYGYLSIVNLSDPNERTAARIQADVQRHLSTFAISRVSGRDPSLLTGNVDNLPYWLMAGLLVRHTYRYALNGASGGYLVEAARAARAQAAPALTDHLTLAQGRAAVQARDRYVVGSRLYAGAAYLFDHYGDAAVRQLLQASHNRTRSEVQALLAGLTGRDINDLDAAVNTWLLERPQALAEDPDGRVRVELLLFADGQHGEALVDETAAGCLFEATTGSEETGQPGLVGFSVTLGPDGSFSTRRPSTRVGNAVTLAGRLVDGRLEGTYRVVNEITACDSGPIPFSPV